MGIIGQFGCGSRISSRWRITNDDTSIRLGRFNRHSAVDPDNCSRDSFWHRGVLESTTGATLYCRWSVLLGAGRVDSDGRRAVTKTLEVAKLTPLEAASYLCSWCKQHGPPTWKSGPDPVGGWTGGFTHQAKGGLVSCAAQQLWSDSQSRAA